VQRSTVKNEKQQNYDNRPYGPFRENNMRALYPYGHPYSWLTIGLLEDLDRANVNDLKNFFLRWYGPNNAVLTVGGDLNPKEVVAMVEKYFGSIPRGIAVENMKLDPVVLDANRYISYYDKNIRFPALIITYPTVPRFDPDEAPLDCLAEIIGSGKSSYFYQRFVKTQKAIQANVSHPASELAGELTMFVLPFPGNSLSDMEADVLSALEDFEKDGVADEDIEKFKAKYESRTINGLATVAGKVSQLANFQTFTGNANFIQKDLERYLAVTKEDVMRVYNQYIKGKYAVVQSVLASADGVPAKPDNFTATTSGNNPFPTTDYSGLTYHKTKDTFDRSMKPKPTKAAAVKVPDFWRVEEENGLKIIGMKSEEIPTVSVQITINGGHKLEALDPSKSGLAVLTASMLNESTKNYTAQEIAVELEKLGSRIGVHAGATSTSINMRSLTKNLDATLKLLEEKLFNPKFSEDDFSKVKKQQLEGVKAQQKQPVTIADNVYSRLLYGDKHIMSVPSSGIEETVNKISLDDVKDFYAKYYSPSVSEVVIVGDMDKETILSKIDFLKNWKAKKVDMPKFVSKNNLGKTKLYLVDKKKAPQSEIRIGYMTDMPYDATGDYYKSNLANYTLGGAFNSRINLNLREDKGYTYGASSYFNSGDDPGPYTARAGVRANVTDSAVFEFMKEITKFTKEGISKEELSFMKNSIGQRDARAYEAPWQKAGFLERIVHYNLDKDFVDEQNKIVENITKEDIDALVKKNIQADNMNIVVVGDKESLKPKLLRLGYEIIDVDEKGNIIKDNTKIKTGK